MQLNTGRNDGYILAGVMHSMVANMAECEGKLSTFGPKVDDCPAIALGNFVRNA
jgi:hypothetical protein